MAAKEPLPETCRLIRVKEVLEICGLSRAALYRGIKAQEFPAPVKLSARSVGWLKNEVIAWVEARAEHRASRRSP
jgi:prophage regulatory protein